MIINKVKVSFTSYGQRLMINKIIKKVKIDKINLME